MVGDEHGGAGSEEGQEHTFWSRKSIFTYYLVRGLMAKKRKIKESHHHSAARYVSSLLFTQRTRRLREAEDIVHSNN